MPKQKNWTSTTRKQSLATWNDYLGRIKAEGKNEKDKTKFYTGLYHALLGHGLGSDVNGTFYLELLKFFKA